MNILVAETPKEFREKVIEMHATSIVFKNGNFQGTLPIVHRTEEKVEKVFNDCISKAFGNSPDFTRAAVTIEAHKNGNAIITAKWMIIRMPCS